MSRIILTVKDEQKASRLLAHLRDLDYIEAQVEPNEKKWKGYLPVFDNPIFIPGFTMFSREELYDR